MLYDEARDVYVCHAGKELKSLHEHNARNESGYQRKITVYRCEDCSDCPYKSAFIKGNHCKTPMSERNKVIQVSKSLIAYRKADMERIESDYGSMLRMNRSIQAEGSFADVKEDMNFRRYLYRGSANALAESILLAMGRNIRKLHCKIQAGRTGTHLFKLKTE